MSFTTEMRLIFEKLQYLSHKAKVDSDNLARSSIPNETMKSIAPFKSRLLNNHKTSPGTVSLTNVAHITGGAKSTTGGYKIKDVKSKNAEVNLAGNTISQEEVLLQLNESATELYRLEQAHKNITGRWKTIFSIGSK